MNLKKRILKELDDLDWIRDVEPFIPFGDVKVGELYKAEITDQALLNDVLENCSLDYLDGDNEYIVYVGGFNYNLTSEDIFCLDGYFDGEKHSLHLTFYDMNDGTLATDLWVIEDLVKLYPLEKDVKSNFKKNNPKYHLGESDDLEWMRGDVYFGIDEILGKKMLWRENNVNTLQDSGMQLQDIRKEDITFGPVRFKGGWTAVGINTNGSVICRVESSRADTFYAVEDVEKYVNLGIWVLLDDNGEPLNLF